MLTALEAAQLCADSYDKDAKWDHIWEETDAIPAHICVRRSDSGTSVVFRGSFNPEDWFYNFNVFVYDHPLIGQVMGGFFHGLQDRYAEVADFVGHGTAFVGHSRGAAQAVLMAALFTAKGLSPSGVIGFGCPNTGYGKHAEILKSVPGLLFKNRIDPVTDVPIPALGFPWQKAYAQTHVDIDPAEDDLSPLRDHHIGLYLKACQNHAQQLKQRSLVTS